MRKNQIIEYLSKLKGNPEIFVWDESIGDTRKINDIVPTLCYRRTKELARQIEEARALRWGDTPPTEEELDEIMKQENWVWDRSWNGIGGLGEVKMDKIYDKKKIVHVIELKRDDGYEEY